MKWRIYYEDGSTFEDKDGTPWEAPRTGVQLIAAWENTGWLLLSQADFYYYEPERVDSEWWHCGVHGMHLHLQRAKRPLILFGAFILSPSFTEIEKRALAEIRHQRWVRGKDVGSTGTVMREGDLP